MLAGQNSTRLPVVVSEPRLKADREWAASLSYRFRVAAHEALQSQGGDQVVALFELQSDGSGGRSRCCRKAPAARLQMPTRAIAAQPAVQQLPAWLVPIVVRSDAIVA
jgi:hypothetical protein